MYLLRIFYFCVSILIDLKYELEPTSLWYGGVVKKAEADAFFTFVCFYFMGGFSKWWLSDHICTFLLIYTVFPFLFLGGVTKYFSFKWFHKSCPQSF